MRLYRCLSLEAQLELERAVSMGEDPFKLEPTPEENNQALFEAEKIVCSVQKMSAQAGVRQYDDDPKLDVPEDEQDAASEAGFLARQDLWGAPKGFSELTSINQEAGSRSS